MACSGRLPGAAAGGDGQGPLLHSGCVCCCLIVCCVSGGISGAPGHRSRGGSGRDGAAAPVRGAGSCCLPQTSCHPSATSCPASPISQPVYATCTCCRAWRAWRRPQTCCRAWRPGCPRDLASCMQLRYKCCRAWRVGCPRDCPAAPASALPAWTNLSYINATSNVKRMVISQFMGGSGEPGMATMPARLPHAQE